MALDKRWLNIDDRSSIEYRNGVNNFIEWAFKAKGGRNRIRCPCDRCRNTEFMNKEEVRGHIFKYSFYKGYTFWSYHGEEEEEISSEEDSVPIDMQNVDHDEFDALLEDAGGNVNMDFGVIGQAYETHHDDEINRPPNPEAAKFYNFIEDGKQKLYPGCDDQLTKLSYAVKLLHQKCLNKWTDKSMDSLLKHDKEILPKGALVPDSYYDAKKIVKHLGLDYVKIEACQNDCILYWKEYENATQCPICGEHRWKNVGGGGNESHQTKRRQKNIPHKVLRYFPITPRLQRLYMSRKTAKDMRWHKEGKSNDSLLRHPTDSMAWKSFDENHHAFANDSRSVRFGLASDGFNPYGNMSSSYSVWPVVLVPYNLPPWLCMKQPYFMMALLIPGKNSPGNDIDVYLQPLIDELKTLWEVGVDTYDAHSHENFKLHAAIIWTINDFPAYENLSGWITKGKLACPCCHNSPSYYSLRSKVGFMGHRRFLPINHRWRKDAKSFDGKVEHRPPPELLSGDEVLNQLNDLQPVIFGKGQKRKRDDNTTNNWSKKSIFFDLPYWRTLLLRHNLDVMHIERNVSDSVLGTLMGTDKSKDTLKARCDLVDMGIRSNLHPYEANGLLRKPNAIYNLSPIERMKLCEFLKDLKVPDGFASNISRCVNLKERKISGMKCHDHHIFLQYILPLVANGLLHKDICEPLIELSIFFKELSSKILRLDVLDDLEKRVAITLCKLEKIFPPAFFDVMIHLCIHLVGEAKIAGPVQYRWMYPIERYLRTLKSYVRNKARPEGSIAEGYIVDECLTFCSRYLNSVDTKFNRPPRNDDLADSVPSVVSIFNKKGCAKGAFKTLSLSREEINGAFMYILQNCEEVWPFIDQHKTELASESDINVMGRHKAQFQKWFYKEVSKLHNNGCASDDLYNLAIGPHGSVRRYDTFIVNGFKFHTKDRERFLKCQNNGVVVKGDDSSNEKEYYGVLTDIYKFSFVGNNEVFLFKCNWYDVQNKVLGYKIDKWGFTSVNSSRRLKSNETYVLASQAGQVFYVKDMRNPQWLYVNKTAPRDLYSMSFISTSEDVTDEPLPTNDEAFQENEVQANQYQWDVIPNDNVHEELRRNDYEEENVSGRLRDFLNERESNDDAPDERSDDQFDDDDDVAIDVDEEADDDDDE